MNKIFLLSFGPICVFFPKGKNIKF